MGRHVEVALDCKSNAKDKDRFMDHVTVDIFYMQYLTWTPG